MKSVKMKVSDLVTKLKSNRIKHEKEYREAVADFRTLCKKKLTWAVSKVKEPDAKIDISKQISSLSISESAPCCYLRSYDRAITMLEMSSDTIIEVTEEDFRNYVMDEWNWKDSFTISNRGYKMSVNEFCMPASMATVNYVDDDPESIG